MMESEYKLGVRCCQSCVWKTLSSPQIFNFIGVKNGAQEYKLYVQSHQDKWWQIELGATYTVSLAAFCDVPMMQDLRQGLVLSIIIYPEIVAFTDDENWAERKNTSCN